MGVDLYWLPLGAGGSYVRLNGRVYEALVAGMARRRTRDLFHAALEITLDEHRSVIELAPVPDGHGDRRGVVATGAVGSRYAGVLRIFRYELRCWPDGSIPDVAEAVDSPQRVTDDEHDTRHVVELLPSVPTAVWGRDQLRAGEMWTSNSVIAWLLVRARLDLYSVRLPDRGRAPGWDAGVRVAHRNDPSMAHGR